MLCAFIYDEAAGMPDEGIAPGTRWADVPETWTCPDCSASKADFDQWGRIAREVAKAGLPLNQHATLTGSIDGILDEIEAIDKDYPVRNLRWSLIHLDQLSATQMERMKKLGVEVVLAAHWGEGGKGAAELAKVVVELCEQPSSPTFVYEDGDSLWDKMNKIAKKIYRASDVTADTKVRNQIKKLQEDGYGHYPVCVAKTQSSFSTDPNLRGAPSGHIVNIREVRLAAGAEFVVMVCGDIMTMPGLPKVPSAEKIDLTDDGKVVGLF